MVYFFVIYLSVADNRNGGILHNAALAGIFCAGVFVVIFLDSIVRLLGLCQTPLADRALGMLVCF